MISIIAGLACLAATVWIVAVFRGRDGQMHPWIKLPGVEITLPIGLMVVAAFGVGLIAQGLSNW
jgi:hypothetical protein